MGEDVNPHLENIQLNKAYWKSLTESSANASSISTNSPAAIQMQQRNTLTQTRGSSSLEGKEGGSSKSSRENLHNRASVKSNSKQELQNSPMKRTASRDVLHAGHAGKRITGNFQSHSPQNISDGSLRRNRADSSAK